MKTRKEIFVIMPFTNTHTRTSSDLDEFYRTNIKARIEEYTGFLYNYTVRRSESSFDINRSLIHDLYEADIVLCDLSGDTPNPNVMYELGIRLSITNKPVILFRETTQGKLPFDIGDYHTYEYSITRYRGLEEYIRSKIIGFETKDEEYFSPVLSSLKMAPSVIKELQKDKIIKTITAAFTGVRGGLRGLLGCVAAYVQESIPNLQLPTTVEEFPAFILQNQKALEQLDWRKFSFTLQPPPGLFVLLTDLPLDSYIGTTTAKVWNTVLSEFFTKFYATDFVWHIAPWPTLHNFAIQGTNLYLGLFALAEYIGQEDKEKKELAFKHMKDSIESLSPKYSGEVVII